MDEQLIKELQKVTYKTYNSGVEFFELDYNYNLFNQYSGYND